MDRDFLKGIAIGAVIALVPLTKLVDATERQAKALERIAAAQERVARVYP